MDALAPLVYVRQPGYWGSRSSGRVPGEIVLPATAPYHVSIPLAEITGTKGIEVVGATETQRLDVAATPARPTAAPAIFELRGGGAELEYHTPAAPGGRRLCFRNAEHDRIFGEDEIRAQDGDLGELVGVTLRDAPDPPDAPLVKLTLTVPALDFGGDAQIAVATVALLSTDRRPALVAPAPQGQLVTYEDIALAGTARRATRSAPWELVFSRDDRPVDGELKELVVARDDEARSTRRCGPPSSTASTAPRSTRLRRSRRTSRGSHEPLTNPQGVQWEAKALCRAPHSRRKEPRWFERKPRRRRPPRGAD